MSIDFGAMCDDFYISNRLSLKLEMSLDRESVLHFFDRIRREFPAVKRLRRKSRGLSLEEDADAGGRRWVRMDGSSLRFGCIAPIDRDDVCTFGEFILEQAPYHLTLSDLVYDHLQVAYGFDMRYRGNHDQLVAETLFPEQPAHSLLFGEHAAHVIDAQPYYGVALNPSCDLQAYLQVKSRTTTYEVRSGNFTGGPISVLLIVRKYWVDGKTDLAGGLRSLFETADELAAEKIVPNIVNPLAAAIASR